MVLRSPPLFDINSIVLLIILLVVLVVTFVNTLKRGRDSGLSGRLTLFLFVMIPFIAIVLMEQFEIAWLGLLGYLFIIYLLLMPSTIKELKVISKIEKLLIWFFISLFSLLFLAAITPCMYSSGHVKKDLTCVNMKNRENALKKYKTENAEFPATEEGMRVLILNSNLLKYPKDAWNKKIIYVKSKEGFELISYGADRKKGGEDESDDIYYSECFK